jgi:peroxiredoxin
MMKRVIIIAVLFMALGTVFAMAMAAKNAPSCVFYDLGDNPMQLSYYKNKPVILFFWATWCPYCREEMLPLNSRYPELLQDGIKVIGVNIKEPRNTIVKFINSKQIDFEIWQDKDGSCASSFGIVGIPTYILINKSGKITAKANSLPADYKELLLK